MSLSEHSALNWEANLRAILQDCILIRLTACMKTHCRIQHLKVTSLTCFLNSDKQRVSEILSSSLPGLDDKILVLLQSYLIIFGFQVTNVLVEFDGNLIILDTQEELSGIINNCISIIFDLPPLICIPRNHLIITLMWGLILALLFVMPLQTGDEVSDGEFTLAVIAFPVSIVAEAGHVHILPTRLVGTQGKIIIWVQDLSTHAAWLQLRNESLCGLIKSLSEEENIKVIQLLVQESRGNIC